MATEHEFEEFTEGELPEDINFQDLLVDKKNPRCKQTGYFGRFCEKLGKTKLNFHPKGRGIRPKASQ